MSKDKRIIEIAFPVEEVSEQGRRPQSEITGLHIYWSSKPLGPSRATTYAALVDSDSPLSINEKYNSVNSEDLNFIAELAKWENALKPFWIQEAKENILKSHDGKPPKVLDPFGGRGAIPLEAQRLGCETYSCDLNPVAVLIQKCTLEYPQKYGHHLHDDVKKWGDLILAQLKEELAPFYPKEPDGSDVYAYVWARTLPCQNLNCNAVIPLMSQFWLAQNSKRRVALFPYKMDGHIAFRIVGTGHGAIPDSFDPAKGTVIRAIVTCPLCNSTIAASQTRWLFQDGQAGERMLAVVTRHPKRKGKQYRLAADKDLEIFDKAQECLSEKRERLRTVWGIDPVPDEPTPKIKGAGAERGFAIRNYNLNTYGALFNARQQLTLVTLTEKIRDAQAEMRVHGNHDLEYAKAISTYLGLWLDRIADKGSNLCLWRKTVETVEKLFGMATLPMIWNYGEANPFHVGANRLKTLLKPMLHLCLMDKESTTTTEQASAQNLPYSDNTFDAVLTDPPYYDNAAYAYLSDFFYVWLKRSIGEHHPELFKEPLTPKDTEIVAYGHREGGLEAGKQVFEDGLAKAFQEMRRVLKPDGIAVIVYAHKSTEGWETLINALLDSGLVVTGAWPIDTEKKSRLRAINSAVLASSIYMVARKKEQEPFGLYQDVKMELETYLEQKLFTLWELGFSGADLFIAAIGIGIEVFGKYEIVLDDDDNFIRADRMIADIRTLLERFDGEKSGIAGTQLTRFYLRWRREYGEKFVLFNDARELALSLGIELTSEWKEGSFIQQEKTNVRVLGPQEREQIGLSNSEELIDILHQALFLWSSGNREAMIQCLSKENIGLNELIWNVAQQISASLPADSQERQWLDGWLADQRTIQREIASIVENLHHETLL